MSSWISHRVHLPVSPAQLLAGVLVGALATAGWYIARRLASYARLPPGPQPYLFLGTPIPELFPWRHFYALAQQHGPLVTIWDGTRPIVVCSDVATADFFLDKKARDTVDRPSSYLTGEIFSHNKRTLLVPYSERWRRLRKALHKPLQPQAARDLRPYQVKTARRLILDILRAPDGFQNHIQTYTATLVVHMAYGRTDVARYSDPDIRMAVEGSLRVGILLRPGSFKLAAIPLLRYVCGDFNMIKQWGADELNLFRSGVDRVRQSKAEVPPCFATYLMKSQNELGLNDDEVAYLCGSVFGAGSDTSASAIAICIMAAAVYPETQARVQAELARVVGDRPPGFDDMDDLPLLRAFVAETFRWRPVSAGGFQHKTVRDIGYEDYVVPAGTTIVGNHWAIHRDESYYGPDVEELVIDRWLTPDGNFNTSLKHYQFGFGRRVCPGQHVALQSVLITAALLLWAFDIAPKRDAEGRPVPIDTLAFSNTANWHPLPFKAAFTPRHKDVEESIVQCQETDA